MYGIELYYFNLDLYKKYKSCVFFFSEREGFEPPVTAKPRQFSKLVQLTTLPPFHLRIL